MVGCLIFFGADQLLREKWFKVLCVNNYCSYPGSENLLRGFWTVKDDEAKILKSTRQISQCPHLPKSYNGSCRLLIYKSPRIVSNESPTGKLVTLLFRLILMSTTGPNSVNISKYESDTFTIGSQVRSGFTWHCKTYNQPRIANHTNKYLPRHYLILTIFSFKCMLPTCSLQYHSAGMIINQI